MGGEEQGRRGGFVNLLRLKLSSNVPIVYLIPSYPLSSPLRVRDCGPALESLPHLLPVVRRRQQMSSRSEVLSDRTIGRQEALRMTRLLEPLHGIFHIPPNLVVERLLTHRKPPEVRIWRLRSQSRVGTVPPSTSTPHCPAC